MKRQSAIGLLVCLLVIIIWVAGSQTEAGPIAQEWPQFREKAHGVSFAYPPELRLVIAPAGHLRGLGGWVSQVSLVAVDADAAEQMPAVVVSNVYLRRSPAGPARALRGRDLPSKRVR